MNRLTQLSDDIMVRMYEHMSGQCQMDQHVYKAQRMVKTEVL